MSRALSTRRAAHKSSKLLKKLPEEVKLIRQAYPTAAVELWRSDEHRIGLKPTSCGGFGHAVGAVSEPW